MIQNTPKKSAEQKALVSSLLAVVSLVCLLLVIYLIQEDRTRNDETGRIPQDLLAAEGELRARFDGATEFLYLLAEDFTAGHLNLTSFDQKAVHYIKAHPEILNFTWADANFHVLGVAPLENHQQFVGIPLTIEQDEVASRKARDTGRAVFTKVFVNIDHDRGFSLFIPIYKNKQFLGTFSCSYSLDGLLQKTMPTWVQQKYQISLLEENDLIIARHQPSGKVVQGALRISDRDLTGQGLRLQLHLMEQGQDWRQILLLAISIGIIVGVILVVIGLSRDLVRRKQAAEELSKAKALAEAANQSKSQFIANISHEIRTPIGAMMGYADLLLRPNVSPRELNNGLNAIKRNGHNLLQIINDLLDLSKIEAGLLECDPHPIQINEIFEETMQSLAPLAQAKNLLLSCESLGLVPETIQADPLRLKQVLLNIIGNAIKFTERGSVNVQARIIATDDNQGTLAISVTDTGIGISDDQKSRLFQPFSQGGAAIAVRFGGTGLGLALSRRLAEAMGGHLELTATELGKGSQFTLTLPIDAKAKGHWIRLGMPRTDNEMPDINLGEHPKRLANQKILVVEDGFDNQVIVRQYLESEGAIVMSVMNGNEAIALLDQVGLQKIDAVLMDIQMPEMDGYETTAQFRSRGFQKPIIALTANAMKGEREKCLQAGCADFLTKPIDPERMITTILHQISPQKHQAPTVKDQNQTKSSDTSRGDAPLVSTLIHDPRVASVVRGFVERLPARISKISEAIQDNDWQKVSQLAHALKGTAGNYGYPAIVETAIDIEKLAMTDPSAPPLMKQVNRLQRLSDKVKLGLEESHGSH